MSSRFGIKSASPASPPSSLALHRSKIDENSNTASGGLGSGSDRHADSISPVSMGSSHHEDERMQDAKSKFFNDIFAIFDNGRQVLDLLSTKI